MTTKPQKSVDQRQWGWLVLFTSSSTLICCALPILLVTLGLGAVSATMFESLPFLVTLAQNKVWMFLGSAGVLALGGYALFRPNRSCPIDPVLAAKCETAHRLNKRIWMASVVMWSIGFAAAYLSLPIWQLFQD